MFCSMCGTHLQTGSKFCSKCGHALLGPSATAGAQPMVSSMPGGAIWNPNVASNWSLIFSPAFSSYLHALNWRALGEPRKEKAAMLWCYCSLAMLGVYVLIGEVMDKPEEAIGANQGLGFIYLLLWYFSTGRSQARYIKQKFGSNYVRRGWGKPLLIGTAASVGYIIFAGIVGVMTGAMHS